MMFWIILAFDLLFFSLFWVWDEVARFKEGFAVFEVIRFALVGCDEFCCDRGT